MKQFIKGIPGHLKGTMIRRIQNCSICNENSGLKIGTVDYWDIKTSNLVRCNKCKHIQLDPRLTENDTAKGIEAFYFEESARFDSDSESVNSLRNFRRGVLFAHSLRRRNIIPRSVMELGPGSGYFSAGFKFVFPKADITVIDINQRVIEFNREHHGYAGVCDFPDVKNEDFEGKFDLVIARDIIEHVNDISRVLNNVNRYLIPGGHFHFITPNGHEDVWKHYLTEIHTGLPSELLINHVNYFDGRGLAELLEATGFEMVDYYTYKLRTFLRGEGWSRNRKHMNPVSAKKNSAVIFGSEGKFSGTELAKARILDKWYINNRHKWITILFCYYQHFEIFRLNPSLNVGHEIYGLFRKR